MYILKETLIHNYTNTVCDLLCAPDVFHCQMPAVSEHRCRGDPIQDYCVKAANEIVHSLTQKTFFMLQNVIFTHSFRSSTSRFSLQLGVMVPLIAYT